MSERVCLVTGVGPGTGAALARRFAAGGYRVAMLARNAGAVDFAGLKVDMTAAAETVRAHYRAIIDVPAAEARTRLPRTKLDEEKTI